ncbi:MAG: hypothetical protein WB511_00645 [Nitrososphaeraceae archaeon]|jgi:hypothetical protein
MMLKKLSRDKMHRMLTLEMSEDDLKNIIESVDNMVSKEQRTLLENLPSDDEVRSRLDGYKALKEDLRKIFEGMI